MLLHSRTSSRPSAARSAAAVFLAAVFLAGCSSTDNNLQQEEKSAAELYNDASMKLKTARSPGVTLFDEVERQHPYSELATKSQLMSAWALYQSNNYVAAIGALDRFIELNPAHENIDYALHLKAQSYYEQIVDVERDAGMTVKAGSF